MPIHQRHPDSYYAATANGLPPFDRLQQDRQADVCIVGGGLTGVNTALELAERGVSVVLLEAREIGWGASGRNGGQLIRGVGHDIERFRPLIGENGIQALQRMGFEAVDIVRQRIDRYAIDCDLHWGYCDVAERESDWRHLQEEYTALQAQGYPHALELVPRQDIHQVVGSDRYIGGLIDHGSGHLHPLNLTLGEADAARRLGAQLFEHSPVSRIEYGETLRIHTADNHTVTASTLVLACNAYLNSLHRSLSAKVLPAGSYIIATQPLPAELATQLLPQNMAICDQRMIMDYYRLSADRRLLFGGACRYSGRDPSDIEAYMRPKMTRVFPQLADVPIEYQWGGMIGIGANRLPQIGRMSHHSNVYYAQAYSGHGLNATHLAARLLSEVICGEPGEGFELFDRIPHMSFPGGQWLRSPLLALGMSWYRLKDLLAK